MGRMLTALAAAAVLLLQAGAGTGETLAVDPARPVHGISQTLYGLFFEDINHAADGGLYAELLQNRSFEYEELLNPAPHQHLTGWAFNMGTGKGQIGISTEDPLNENNRTYIRLDAEDGYAFQNLGWGQSAFRGGIPVRKGELYDVSVWLRSVSPGESAQKIAVSLTTRAGAYLSSEVVFEPGGSWKRMEAVLEASETAEDACLSFRTIGAGETDVDMASLMPRDRIGAEWPGGGMRRDLVEALAELHPAFVRFPGGCVTEGSWVWENLYRWKDTIGPVEERKENWNTWGYMQSYGIGFYEYFCLCEEIGALPLPVVGSGVLCQAREPAESPMNEEELADWTRDVLDLVEFAKGDAGTEWGALRAAMGHEEPFDLRFLAIGNENWANIYFDRYEKIRNAVKEAWPEITCIVANGPVADGSLFSAGRSTILRRFPEDLADEHYYMDSGWFLKNTHRYDLYPRSSGVFLGEYAAHESAAGGRRPNNLYSALCEAAYLTGIERNSDVVRMCCYAPLLARQGMDQWTPDLIWFDGTRVLRTPNYYIQQIFSGSLAEELIESRWITEGADPDPEREGLYQTAGRKKDGTVYIKIVNVSGEEREIRVTDPEGNPLAGRMTVLSGERQAVNTLSEEKVKPEEMAFEGSAVFPGYAAAVIEIRP